MKTWFAVNLYLDWIYTVAQNLFVVWTYNDTMLDSTIQFLKNSHS